MAKHGSVEVLQWFYSEHSDLPRADTLVVKVGDLLSLESNTLVHFSGATDDATFVGIAASEHENGVDGNVVIAPKAIIKIDCTSATYGYGDGLLYVAGSATVEYSVADDSGANTIMWCYREYTAAVTRLVAYVHAPILQKLFSSNA